jgi:tetratricopeptide (TPR) repeat protein
VEFAEQQPNLAFPHHIAALYHHGKGDMESAVTFMQEALTRSPNEESLYGDMAMLLGITGRFEEIINLLKGRFEKDELQPIHLWNLALAYRDLDKSQEAIEIFTRFLDMDISEEYKKMALREVERLSELKKPH